MMDPSAREPRQTRTRPTTERAANRAQSRWRMPFGRRRVSPAIVILTIAGVLFAVNFIQQVVRQAQLEAYRERVMQDIAALESTNAELLAQAEYFESDDYAELVAREQFGYAREGDVVLMPTFPERGVLDVPAPSPTTNQIITPQPNWMDWFNFLRSDS